MDGSHNNADVRQTGHDNIATGAIDGEGIGTGSSGARLDQQGDGHRADIRSSGFDNGFDVRQTGSLNDVRLTQDGTANIAALLQSGSANRASVSQTLGGWASNRSEEHTSELQSLMRISYAVFCLKKKKDSSKQPTAHYYITQQKS